MTWAWARGYMRGHPTNHALTNPLAKIDRLTFLISLKLIPNLHIPNLVEYWACYHNMSKLIEWRAQKYMISLAQIHFPAL
jgi:hypothetical protein